MSEITKLILQRNPNFVNVFIDGKYKVSLDLATVTQLGLKTGLNLSEADLRRLEEKSQFEKLYNRALNFLSYRPRSEKEVINHFLRNVRIGQAESERKKNVNKLIEKLKQKGLLNDLEFAKWWVEQRQTFRRKSKFAVINELRQKGISPTTASEVLTHFNDAEIALSIAKKKIKSIKEKSHNKRRWKLGELLKRHGFSWETIRTVVDELIPQE